MPIAKLNTEQQKRQAKIDKEIIRIKKEKLKEKKYCRGCYNNFTLTASHIIRRSQRPDLTTEWDNITIHCINCHEKWDSNELSKMVQLIDFPDNMYYISQVDKKRFLRLMFKIQEYVKK